MTEKEILNGYEYVSKQKNLSWISKIKKEIKPLRTAKDIRSIAVFKNPVEFCILGIEDESTFRLIPSLPMLAINEIGIVVNLLDGSIIETAPPSKFFVYYTMTLPRLSFLQKKSIALHRLIAMAWCNNDDYVKNYVVDHVNGNKLNNNAKNLRWISQRMNIARSTNAKSLDYRWEVYDYERKTFSKYCSLTDLEEFYGLDRRYINSRSFPAIIKMKDGNHIIIEDMMHFDDWRSIYKFRDMVNKYKIFYKDLGVTKYFKSLKDVMKATGYSRDLHGSKYNSKNSSDVFKSVQTYLKNRNIMLKPTKERLVKNQYLTSENTYTIQAKNIKTNKILEAPTAKLLAEKIGSKKSTVISRLNYRKNRTIDGLWIIKRSTDKDWPEITGEVVNRPFTLLVESKNHAKEFSSMRSMCRENNFSRSTIRILFNDSDSINFNGFKISKIYK